MGKFTWFRIDNRSNIFLIILKDNKELPLIVHGMLKVEGKKYEKSFCARSTISDELCMSGEINRLEDEVQREYFNIVD
ncbi:MAG: hypothetical protein HFJ41_06955 [Clostridia bacterium]|nr:hypothetical protein [Clostridia bacterium]